MNWVVDFLPEALDDLESLEKETRTAVIAAIKKVSLIPLPQNENGYGKPLANRNRTKLAGLLKIKLLKFGIRVVYKLIRTETSMLIIVIGARKDDEVYLIAEKRKRKYDLWMVFRLLLRMSCRGRSPAIPVLYFPFRFFPVMY